MTYIYLIRHTQAEGNRYRMMQGQWDGSITQMGEKQIEALSKRFQDVRLDAVFSSDLTRAVLTAEGLAKPRYLPVKTERRFRELDLGPWESQFFGNVMYNYPEEAKNFLYAPEQWHITGAETMDDVAKRAMAALTEIAYNHDGESIAVVSHGITIRCVLSKILGRRMTGEELLPIFYNTAVTELVFNNGSFTVKTQGDVSHIQMPNKGDWITPEALRDESFNPATDPMFYISCYQDAWQSTHYGKENSFHADIYYQAALQHISACPDAVKKLYNQEKCVGLIDCDIRKGLHAGYGWISFLYLIPEMRGKGYGAQALGRALMLFRSLGRHAIRLHVAASNEQAIRLYERHGFQVLTSEAGVCGPLYLMEKKL